MELNENILSEIECQGRRGHQKLNVRGSGGYKNLPTPHSNAMTCLVQKRDGHPAILHETENILYNVGTYKDEIISFICSSVL